MAKAWGRGDRSSKTALVPFQPQSEQSAHSDMTKRERSLVALMEQAFRIKEDIVGSLRATQGSVLMETSARKLLESHIQTITHIVKQLSKDIQTLEAQIVQRDSVASGVSFAVQSLDHKNLVGIGDLRGRVARCDASIAKLSGDMRAIGQETLKLQQEVGEMHAGIELRLRDTELKISQSLARLEALHSQQVQHQKNAAENLEQDIRQLQNKTSSQMVELEGEMTRHRRWTEQQMNTHTDQQQLNTGLLDRVADVEGKVSALEQRLCARLERVETRVETQVEKRLETSRLADQARRSNSNTRMDAVEKSVRGELKKMRTEYESGFQSVHDAIASLRHIGEAQAKLHKGELMKDIGRIQQNLLGLPDV
ncbi:protein FAM81B [Brachyhypopomus gauderio]|uniref:protein FAM81B n=1 Tax=Brachyhypopomus gauderio TaxID=698409 RepID=UPI0040411419